MRILQLLRERFRDALAAWTDDPGPLLDMIRPAQDARFGDYQANCAMPLGKQLGKPPREVAAGLADSVQLNDFCETPEVAGPGFINLRLQDQWLAAALRNAATDPRLGLARLADPKTVVIDYSSPNIAKPMHVGHVRSTVIGDAIKRLLLLRGHQVISDNHIGDWGTQFGMMIYGYKHFGDEAAVRSNAVAELSRLYRLVNQLLEYHAAAPAIDKLNQSITQGEQQLAALDPNDKKLKKERSRRARQLDEDRTQRQELLAKRAAVDASDKLSEMAAAHVDIGDAVLRETAKLHAGDEENLAIWRRFLPDCRDEMEKIYRRLDVTFDHELGESFYHDRLQDVIDALTAQGLARESDGALCVFLDQFDAPMIIRKRDGAFLYATTDLATIAYRAAEFSPDEVLYVVDHRQSEHFEKLFAAARQWGYDQLVLRHLSFGTVLGPDGKPFKTRAGAVAGLEALLDDAVANALQVVSENDDAKPTPELDPAERREIANVVGHAAVKYADLSHNRTSDYEFDAQRMVQLRGNTAAYLQYSYARVKSILRRGDIDEQQLTSNPPQIAFADPLDRSLALELLRFEDALDDSLADYRPNLMTSYLFQLAQTFARFFDACPVLKVEDEAVRGSRLLLCVLTGRTLKMGLESLGISVVERM